MHHGASQTLSADRSYACFREASEKFVHTEKIINLPGHDMLRASMVTL